MVNAIKSLIEINCGFSLDGVSDWVINAMIVVVILIAIVTLFSIIMQVYLSIHYTKYNRKQNSIGMSGEHAARKILDDNGLYYIKVKASGSLMFGNSYSHFFQVVRLRRFTWKEASLTSLAMASQKSCLAILDDEGDPDMKKRIWLTPLTCFGPIFALPLVAVGLLLDLSIIKSNNGICTILSIVLGILFYLLSFILSLKTLKTETKAQKRAYELLRENQMATEEELQLMQHLFRLYNIEYINNLILSLLEFLYRILQFIAEIQKDNNDKK